MVLESIEGPLNIIESFKASSSVRVKADPTFERVATS
jgi:hypothetical protein